MKREITIAALLGVAIICFTISWCYERKLNYALKNSQIENEMRSKSIETDRLRLISDLTKNFTQEQILKLLR